MIPFRPLLVMLIILLAGCTSTNGSDAIDEVPPEEEVQKPASIEWFPASSAGAAGNRLTLATDSNIIALDEPGSPWTIHIFYGESLQNRMTLNPEAEPLNLAAAMGPRGPVIVYRSSSQTQTPGSELIVSEWQNNTWAHGRLASNPGEIYGIPSIGSSNSELIVGFPVLFTSLGGSKYSILRLSDGIPAELVHADRIDFANAPLSPDGYVVVRGDLIAVSYTRDLYSVMVHYGPWENLTQVAPFSLPGPNALGVSQSLRSHVAFKSDFGLVVAITEWPLVGGTNPENKRLAVIHDVDEGHQINLETRGQVDLWSTSNGMAVVRQDVDAVYRINMLNAGELSEVSHSDCDQLAILPDASMVSLGRRGGQWTSSLADFPGVAPTCPDDA